MGQLYADTDELKTMACLWVSLAWVFDIGLNVSCGRGILQRRSARAFTPEFVLNHPSLSLPLATIISQINLVANRLPLFVVHTQELMRINPQLGVMDMQIINMNCP